MAGSHPLDPPRLLEYTWDAETLRWELEADGDDTCRLVSTNVLGDRAAQRRLYRLRPEPLAEVDVWLAPYRRKWNDRLDALGRQPDRMRTTEPGGRPQ